VAEGWGEAQFVLFGIGLLVTTALAHVAERFFLFRTRKKDREETADTVWSDRVSTDRHEELLQRQDDLKTKLLDAMNRADQEAPKGEAEAALKKLRNEGKSPELLALLNELSDQAEQSLKSAQADIIERQYEIMAVAFLTGEIDAAHQTIDKILSIDPNNLNAINYLGHIKALKGNPDGAIDAYRRILKLAQKPQAKALAYGNMWNVYQTQGDLPKALEFWTLSERLFRELGNTALADKILAWLNALPQE
jgi:tetratricopeptide (TPR) repeat protein